MSEQELIQALRELIAKASADAPNPRLVAQEINRSDQRRLRWLACLSIFFWLLAALGLVLLCIGLDTFVTWVRVSNFHSVAGTHDRNFKFDPLAPPNHPLHDPTLAMLRGTSLIHHSIGVVAGSVGALFMAALCTVLLVTTSRRATLRQINLSLMQLAEQVRQLQSAHPSEKVRKLENS